MTVEQIMTKEVVTILENETIEQCAKVLTDHKLSGLPVINQEDKLVGVVTEGDLIRRKANVKTPVFIELLGGIIYLDDPKEFLDDVKKAMGLYVHEVMSTNIVSIAPTDTVETAANLLVKYKIKRLPVLEDNNLVGIVARKDIMQYLFNE